MTSPICLKGTAKSLLTAQRTSCAGRHGLELYEDTLDLLSEQDWYFNIEMIHAL